MACSDSFPPLLDVINCLSNRIILLIFSSFFFFNIVEEKFSLRELWLERSIMSNWGTQSRGTIKVERFNINAFFFSLLFPSVRIVASSNTLAVRTKGNNYVMEGRSFVYRNIATKNYARFVKLELVCRLKGNLALNGCTRCGWRGDGQFYFSILNRSGDW